VDGGAGHARCDPFHVEQHVPGAIRRDGDGEGVVHLHGHGASLSLAGFRSVNYARYRSVSAKTASGISRTRVTPAVPGRAAQAVSSTRKPSARRPPGRPARWAPAVRLVVG